MRLIDDDKIELVKIANPKRHKREQGWNEAMDYVGQVLAKMPTIKTDDPSSWKPYKDGIKCEKCDFYVNLGTKNTAHLLIAINSYHYCPGCGRPMHYEKEDGSND